MALKIEQMHTEKEKFVVVSSKRGSTFMVYAPQKENKERERVCQCFCERWAERIAQVLNGGPNKFPHKETGTVLIPGFIITDHAMERWNLRVRRSESEDLAKAINEGVMTNFREQPAIINHKADAIFYLKKDGSRWIILTVVRMSAPFDQ